MPACFGALDGGQSEVAMRDSNRSGYRPLVLVAAIMALAVVLGSGCSSAGSGGTSDRATALVQDHRGAPVSVSWAQALALARRMLSRLDLPPGARPYPESALPMALREPAGVPAAPLADVHLTYRLPQSMRQAFQYMLSHPPSGTLPGAISHAGVAGLTDRAVTYLLRTEPPGVYVAQLALVVVPRPGGGSWLTADAHVAVFLLSSAAERLDPAALHVVTISVTALNSKPQYATRVIMSEAVVARLARLINQMPPEPAYSSRPYSCPGISVIYQLDFAASASAPPAATVAVDVCGIENLTVHGIPGGPREDQAEKLFQAVSQLLPA
jgi:hypothetical protein